MTRRDGLDCAAENQAAFRTFLYSLDFLVLLYQDKRTKQKTREDSLLPESFLKNSP
jgi:hypothetical protein